MPDRTQPAGGDRLASMDTETSPATAATSAELYARANFRTRRRQRAARAAAAAGGAAALAAVLLGPAQPRAGTASSPAASTASSTSAGAARSVAPATVSLAKRQQVTTAAAPE